MQTEIATAAAATFNPANRPGYSTKSNCKRAALKAGIPEHLIVCFTIGANWQYAQKDEPTEQEVVEAQPEPAGEEFTNEEGAAGFAAIGIGTAGPDESPEEEIEAAKKKGGKKALKPKAAPKAAKPAKAKAEKGEKGESKPKGDSLKAKVLAMLKRSNGASTEEIANETGWQAHTIRAFISTVPRKAGLLVKSEKHPTRGRVYRTEASE